MPFNYEQFMINCNKIQDSQNKLIKRLAEEVILLKERVKELEKKESHETLGSSKRSN